MLAVSIQQIFHFISDTKSLLEHHHITLSSASCFSSSTSPHRPRSHHHITLPLHLDVHRLIITSLFCIIITSHFLLHHAFHHLHHHIAPVHITTSLSLCILIFIASSSVKYFSKLNLIVVGYFDPKHIFLNNKNK